MMVMAAKLAASRSAIVHDFLPAPIANLIAEDGAGTVVRDAGRVIPSHEGFLVAEMHADESGTSTETPAT